MGQSLAKRGGKGSGSLRRPLGTRQPKKRVVVVCEGSKTEPNYFAALTPIAKEALIEVTVVDEPATSPKQLVDAACKLLKDSRNYARKSKDENAKVDEVWCVHDVDEHHGLKEARQRALDNGVNLAISNPCIEIWFLLHFQDTKGYLHRHEAMRRLRQEVPNYEKGRMDLQPFLGKYAIARDRAQNLERKHEGDLTPFPEDNPMSGVWRIVDSIRANY